MHLANPESEPNRHPPRAVATPPQNMIVDSATDMPSDLPAGVSSESEPDIPQPGVVVTARAHVRPAAAEPEWHPHTESHGYTHGYVKAEELVGAQWNNGQLNQQMLDFICARGIQNPQAMRQQMQFADTQQLSATSSSLFPHDPSQGIPSAQLQFTNAQGDPNFAADPLHLQALAQNQNQMFPNQGSLRQLDFMLAQQHSQQRHQNGIPTPNSMAALQRLQQQQQQNQQQQQQHVQQSQPLQQQHPQGAPQLPPGPSGPMNPASMPSNLPAGTHQGNTVDQARQGIRMPQHAMQDGQMQTQPRRQPSLVDMSQKAHALKELIDQGESRLETLQTQTMQGPVADQVITEINKVQKDVDMRRTALSKIMQWMRTAQQNATGAVSNGFAQEMDITSPVPPQRSPGDPRNSSEEGLFPPSGTSQLRQFSNGSRPVPGLTQLPQNALANSAMSVPSRQPPQQTLQFPYASLSLENFNRAYQGQWLPRHPIKDPSILHFEGQRIDLYQLHREVMSQDRSYKFTVTQPAPHQAPQLVPVLQNSQELWSVIGARMRWVHFPGTGNEPGRAGPALAAHLEHIYTQCLQEFDSLYLRKVFQHYQKLRIVQLQQKLSNGRMENGGPALDVSQLPQGLSDIKDPNAIAQIISWASLSVAEMQQRGIPPRIIAIVDRHREELKSTAASPEPKLDQADMEVSALEAGIESLGL